MRLDEQGETRALSLAGLIVLLLFCGMCAERAWAGPLTEPANLPLPVRYEPLRPAKPPCDVVPGPGGVVTVQQECVAWLVARAEAADEAAHQYALLYAWVAETLNDAESMLDARGRAIREARRNAWRGGNIAGAAGTVAGSVVGGAVGWGVCRALP